MSSAAETVKVVVRCRPMNSREIAMKCKVSLSISVITIFSTHTKKKLHFDSDVFASQNCIAYSSASIFTIFSCIFFEIFQILNT